VLRTAGSDKDTWGGVLGRADHCRRSAVTSVASLPALATEAWVTSLDATRGSDPRNRRISLGTFDRLHPSRDGGSTKHKSGRSAERPHAEPLSLAGAKRALSWNLDRYPERSELMILAMLTRVWDAPVEAVGAGWRESWKTRRGVQEAGQVTSSGPGRGDPAGSIDTAPGARQRKPARQHPSRSTTSPMVTRTILSGRLEHVWALTLSRAEHDGVGWGERGGRARQPARPLAVSEPGFGARFTVADRVARCPVSNPRTFLWKYSWFSDLLAVVAAHKYLSQRQCQCSNTPLAMDFQGGDYRRENQ
jgi:hypothetical protein